MDNSNNVIVFAAGLLNSAAMGYACTLDRSDRVIGTEYNTDANISPLSWKRLHIGNRWMNHAGLSLYDNTARMYDPLTVRFHTPDPLDYKRPWDSPWSHCGGNPVCRIDADGQDFCVILAPKGTSHLGVLIQHDDGKWHLYSKNGTTSSSGLRGVSESSSGSHDVDMGEMAFESPSDFLDSEYNNSRDNPYMKGAIYESMPKEDATMIDAVKIELNKPYNVISSNCAQAVQAGLNAIGMDDGTYTNIIRASEITNPNVIPVSILNAIIDNNTQKPQIIYKSEDENE